jgi:hypothetical protein
MINRLRISANCAVSSPAINRSAPFISAAGDKSSVPESADSSSELKLIPDG